MNPMWIIVGFGLGVLIAEVLWTSLGGIASRQVEKNYPKLLEQHPTPMSVVVTTRYGEE